MREQIKLIPEGENCYNHHTMLICAFWGEDPQHPKEEFPTEFGYCNFLHKSDFEINDKKQSLLVDFEKSPDGATYIIRHNDKSAHDIDKRRSYLFDKYKGCEENY
jgi:hypothetical protein